MRNYVLQEFRAQGCASSGLHHLDELDGLIIPGGESTTIGKLAVDFGLMEPLREFGKSHAIWGTCAGAVLLAKLGLLVKNTLDALEFKPSLPAPRDVLRLLRSRLP